MFVDWCVLSLTEVFIQPQPTQCPSLCLMERTPLHMFGWLYVILLINRFYAICFYTDRSSRIIILFILFSLFVLSLFFPEICFVLLYAPTHPFPCVPWLPTGLFLMVEPSWPKIFTQNIFQHISFPPWFPPKDLKTFSSTIFGCRKIKNERWRLIAFRYTY